MQKNKMQSTSTRYLKHVNIPKACNVICNKMFLLSNNMDQALASDTPETHQDSYLPVVGFQSPLQDTWAGVELWKAARAEEKLS